MGLLQRLGERFWFIPTVMCVIAFLLAETFIAVDRRLDATSLPAWVAALFYRVGESGSRDILGAIASSSLAVAGTTFSITMAVLALTSSSYGPRLVRNFMADRGNQTVLGVYVATFLYSLIVLRSIRVLGDPGDQEAEVFVPHLAVNAAVVLAVMNVGVLVYFIHHISDSIQISTLSSGVRGGLCRTVDRLYPSEVGRSDPPGRPRLPRSMGDDLAAVLDVEGDAVTSSSPGYVQSVAEGDLLDAAERCDVLLDLRVRPGTYVLPGSTLAVVHPAGAGSDELTHHVRSAIRVADARSPYQDPDFAVQQLTEMAVRALSPGTNDPYTAINALDDLSAGLALLVERDRPSPRRFDDSGVLRVNAPGADPVELISGVLDSMRWYASSAPSVMHATVRMVDRLQQRSTSRELRARLLTHLDLLTDAFVAAGHNQHDVQVFREHVDAVRTGLARAWEPG